jgi:putative inorganic carbon (HCO3(-)) transporter
MTSRATTWESVWASPGAFTVGLLLQPLRIGLASPGLLYLSAMTIFLFRPPDLDFYHLDRMALLGLTFFVSLRTLALRETIPFVGGITLPMAGLLAFAVVRAMRESFDPEIWSLVASKFLVPLVLFHLAMIVFRSDQARRMFEIFVILTLAYLTFTAVAFLCDARSLIFPRFILNESLGIHADRARGPFLQAVANGLSLNLLGILAILFAYRRRIVVLLWLLLPLAVLATMTRAIWISFALSTVALGFRLGVPSIRRACVMLTLAGAVGCLALYITDNSLAGTLRERTAESGPVEARMAVYDAAWDMFQERPLTGWAAGGMYSELARRMPGYHLRVFFVHNTFLSLLIEFGIPGLALYAILFVNLFRLGRFHASLPYQSPALVALRKAWPILLSVYLFNAFFVDMAYQFVIGLIFTVAGILCAPEETSA